MTREPAQAAPPPRPTPEQIAATDPASCVWVGANAGSGKTHVLTQRVARLMLAGAEPQKILCLTYTKAAAAEMQVRLFRLLGDWAMLPDDDLAARLGGLTGGLPIVEPARLAKARRLFAHALETPGGLKIQTIHAFCEGLLRRFPLEARASPRFAVADDRRAAVLAADVRAVMAEAAATGVDDGFDRAAERLTEEGIEALAAAVLDRRAVLAALAEGGHNAGPAGARAAVDEALTAHFGADSTATEQDIARAALQTLDPAAFAGLAEALTRLGGKTEQPIGRLLRAWIEGTATDPALWTKDMSGRVLRQDGAPRSQGIGTKALLAGRPVALEELSRLADWARTTRDKILGARMAARSRDLHAFGLPLLARYDAAKNTAGVLDFDDLVGRAGHLLTRADMRAWVLYKLDRGVEHVLVDEAQDTAPAQWQVIEALAEEFLSGEGAGSRARSLFVVGDEKQSIYSFQGADPQAFGQMRAKIAKRLDALGTPLQRPDLRTSFRSAPAILDFVDAVFADATAGLTVDGAPVVHHAHRHGDQGRVDLWPLVPKAEAPPERDWWRPVDLPPPGNAKDRLAEMVACEIAAMIGQARLPARGGRPGRLVRAGDILVLVARRDRLAQGIIRGLKARAVPVAGADRMRLTGEIAVQDLLALARVATMLSDDLSLAALLRSPLCALSEDDLAALAVARGCAGLWQAVQASDAHAGVAAMLRDMAGQADFLRPYEFFERALIAHDGRRRLLARLGPEAEDAVDELLAQALAYEADNVPSLAGFVAWLETGEHVVKREMDQTAGQVRVMTVHGAKGLEAPVVILPDTIVAGSGGAGRPLLLTAEGGANAPDLTIWAGPKGDDDPVAARARAAAEAREAAERNRLFYVALTRAEDWLILAGAEPGRMPAQSWYAMANAAMAACPGAQPLATPAGEGQRFETGPPGTGAPPPEETAPPAPAPAAPLGRAAPETRRVRRPPSSLAKDDAWREGIGGAGLGREDALAKGLAVHDLLDVLGGHGPGVLHDRAGAVLAARHPGLAPSLAEAAIAEAARVLAMPEAAWLFGPDSLGEVTVTIDDAPGRSRMLGRIDRLVMQPRRVLLLDIKTDAAVLGTPADVPRSYLAQLGAYRAAMTASAPDSAVETAILWTAGPSLMDLPDAAVIAAFAAAVTSA